MRLYFCRFYDKVLVAWTTRGCKVVVVMEGNRAV